MKAATSPRGVQRDDLLHRRPVGHRLHHGVDLRKLAHLQSLSGQLQAVEAELETSTERWLELSEIGEGID